MVTHFAVNKAERNRVLLAHRDGAVVAKTACDLLVDPIDCIRAPVNREVEIKPALTSDFFSIDGLVRHQVPQIVTAALRLANWVHKVTGVVAGTEFVLARIQFPREGRSLELKRARR